MKSILSAPRFLAFLAAFAAFATQTATASFLEDLAVNPNKVASSPYATGGDVILQLGTSEYVHIFTNTAAAATFAPSENLTAWVLLVGGGGGGNACNGSTYPGGAGGGGFVEETGVALAAGDYAVTVGAGGAGVKSNSGYKDGGASTLAVSATETITAYGGGASTRAAGRNGASPSGGAYASGTSYDPGSPTHGTQGNAGYKGHSMGGGGGGAGGAAKAPYGTSKSDTKRYGSAGGDGRATDILGFTQYFGGGGGGASSNNTDYRTNPGGMGGGGTGGAAGQADRTNAYGGENGLGGGAGGVYQASNSGVAGKGGDGIVAIRYAVSATGAPIVRDVSVSCAGGASAAVAAIVANAGTADATVYFKAWPSSGAEGGAGTVTKTVGSVLAGSTYVSLSPVVGGLSFDTTYDWKVWAENSSGTSSVATGTLSTHSTSLAATATGATETTLSGGLYRIFTFAENGTFTVPSGKTGFAKILVVGGGGAGGFGGGGGGGAGGVVYSPEAYLTSGTYAVTVGVGGTAPTTYGSNAANRGGSSSFGDLVSVSGGGAGPNPARAGNNAYDGNVSGGSSAGTFSLKYSVSGIDGQGNAGGNGHNASTATQVNGSYGTSGGGGGASSPGGDGSLSAGGAGGDGLACAITGETLYYGAGGGGSIYYLASGTGGAGGQGGGGAGGSVTSEAEERNGSAGTFYGAGGGSGALNSSGQGGAGGAGYQGVVIVRYTDYSQAGDTPLLEILGVSDIGTDEAALSVSVPYTGSADSTVTLSLALAYEEGGTAFSTRTIQDFVGSQTVLLDSLSPGRTYYVTVTGTASTGSAIASTSFTTAPMFGEPLAYTPAGGVLGYTVDGVAAADSQRLELWVGADASSMTNQATYTDAALLAAGAHTVQPFATEQFGETLSILLRHVAVVGSLAFTNDTAVLSTTIADGATYTWRSDVPDGLWCDSANWTSSGGMRGWPTAGSTAKFPAMTATARVDRAVTVAQTQFTANGAVTLKGTVAAASLTTGFSNDTTSFPAGNWTLDGLALVRSPSVKVTMNGNTATLVLTNGASYASADDFVLANSTASATIRKGSSLSIKTLGGAGTAGGALPTFLLDGGTITTTDGVNLSYGGAVNKPGLHLILAGASARITSGNGSFFSTYTNAVVTLELDAAGGYSRTDALIKATGGSTMMAASGYTLVFEAPLSSVSKKSPRCDIMVADWSRSSINTSLVAFGEHEENADCYFFYTTDADPSGTRYKSGAEVTAAGATVKYLWYHHHASPGFFLSVR
jgi:hypothetical protein